MSILITLGADFIEKLSNPANGPLVNEEYSLKFGKLTQEDGFKQLFSGEVEKITSAEELSSYGWLWLIKWCRVNEVQLPYGITIQLITRWSNVFIQTAIIDLMTHDDDGVRVGNTEEGVTINNDWISDVVRACTESQKNEPFSDQSINTSLAENLLIAFLQTGNVASIAGAKYLLMYNWPGKERLANFFEQRLERLDSSTREVWNERIRL